MNIIFEMPGLALLLFILILLLVSSKKKNSEKIRKIINSTWAKLPDRIAGKEDMDSIASYFENLQNAPSRGKCIDNITWNDLELDKVFNIMNSTLTTVGEEYLYNILRCPVFQISELEERDRLIEFFQKDHKSRLKIQMLLAALGKIRHLNTSDFFFCKDHIRYKNKKFYCLLALFLLISTVYMVFFDVRSGGIAFILAFITNAAVYYKVKNTIDHKLESLGYIIHMVNIAKAITKLDIPELSIYQRKFNKSIAIVKKAYSKAFYALNKAHDPITEYVKTLLFVELIAFENCHNFIIANRDEIRNIYEILGYIDSMIAAASFRECADYYCEPYFTERDNNSIIEVKAIDLFHPLIKNPKTYSFDFDKPVLITGSNASGKSTFLKSVAINAILAQTIYTCLAREFSIPQSMVYTSMALKDNLQDNESYFIVELKSLKRIIDAVHSGIPSLCIIDEVLRGTNTIERIAASAEVLYSLGNNNCICIAATHDIELAAILEEIYENYHFREEITADQNIEFDYVLYPGRSCTRNALKLLKLIGYGSSIVERAQERSDKFISEGVWIKIQYQQQFNL